MSVDRDQGYELRSSTRSLPYTHMFAIEMEEVSPCAVLGHTSLALIKPGLPAESIGLTENRAARLYLEHTWPRVVTTSNTDDSLRLDNTTFKLSTLPCYIFPPPTKGTYASMCLSFLNGYLCVCFSYS